MKKLLLLLLAVILMTVANGSGIRSSEPNPTNSINRSISLKEFVRLTPKDYEKLTGKKLKMKEKIGLKLLQWKVKRKMKSEATPQQRKLGRISMIFGIVALGFLFIPVGIFGLLAIGLAIGALVLGIKSTKGNSNTPGIIGIVLGSLVLLLVLIIIAAVIGGAVFY